MTTRPTQTLIYGHTPRRTLEYQDTQYVRSATKRQDISAGTWISTIRMLIQTNKTRLKGTSVNFRHRLMHLFLHCTCTLSYPRKLYDKCLFQKYCWKCLKIFKILREYVGQGNMYVIFNVYYILIFFARVYYSGIDNSSNTDAGFIQFLFTDWATGEH